MYLRKIRLREKTIEVRKTFPNKALTTSNDWKLCERKGLRLDTPFRVLCCESGSGGKIVAEFTCDGYDELRPSEVNDPTAKAGGLWRGTDASLS